MPYVVTLSVADGKPTSQQHNVVLVVYYNTAKTTFSYIIYTFQPFSSLKFVLEKALPSPSALQKFPSTAQIGLSRFSMDGASDNVLISDGNGNFVVYTCVISNSFQFNVLSIQLTTGLSVKYGSKLPTNPKQMSKSSTLHSIEFQSNEAPNGTKCLQLQLTATRSSGNPSFHTFHRISDLRLRT